MTNKPKIVEQESVVSCWSSPHYAYIFMFTMEEYEHARRN